MLFPRPFSRALFGKGAHALFLVRGGKQHVKQAALVGDAAFQKKCLGKMGAVVREGRTVLFVSHNMAAIRGLCERVLLIAEGRLACEGSADQVVQEYLIVKANQWIESMLLQDGFFLSILPLVTPDSSQ